MEAGRLEDDLKTARAVSEPRLMEDILVRAKALQLRIKRTQFAAHSQPRFSLLGRQRKSSLTGDEMLSPADPFEDFDVHEAARSSAEIFRHALHVYVHRIIHDPLSTSEPSPIVQEAVSESLMLLPVIPDITGPGTFLGWALVVLGAEIDGLDHREFIKRRLESLTLLSVNHGHLALVVLDEVWRRRDAIRLGRSICRRVRWQEVMEDMGVDQALV